MILAEVTFGPVGVGISVGKYVNIALDTFRNEGVTFYPNSMGTVLETDTMERMMEVIRKAEEAIMNNGVKRLETVIKIDHRVDIENTAKRKMNAIGYEL